MIYLMASRFCLAGLFITSLRGRQCGRTLSGGLWGHSIHSNNLYNYPVLSENLSGMADDKNQSEVARFPAKTNDCPACRCSWKEFIKAPTGSSRQECVLWSFKIPCGDVFFLDARIHSLLFWRPSRLTIHQTVLT